MSSKLDDYKVVDTISCDGRLGLKQLVCRLPDRRLFESRQISYKFMDDALKEMLVSEVNSLKKLRHPNVIHHEDIIVYREAHSLYLITECGPSDTLQTFINNHIQKKELVEEEFVWSVLSQLTQALHSLSLVQEPYRSQIFHRCLKPSCIYLNTGDGKIKVGDFGLGLMSKPYYQCPEWQKFGLCNEKSDVWSMGCIIYELCTWKRPFRELDHDESHLTEWKIDPLPKKYSRDLESILKFILTPDEDTRPSALMVLHHPLLKKAGNRSTSSGILETDFPVTNNEGTAATKVEKRPEDSTFTNPSVHLDCSGLSLNNYLSMMSEAVDDDVRSVHSLESGSAMPKATSSVLYSPIKMTIKKGNRGNDLTRTEAQLERWAKMLEEKELELTHKERRLRLWEAELMELQRLKLLEAQLAELQRANECDSYPRQSSPVPIVGAVGNESSGVEADLMTDSTTSSVYPNDSAPLPKTAVRLEPAKIRNPFSHYLQEPEKKMVQFQTSAGQDDSDSGRHSSKQFADMRLRWLEIKRRKHLAPAVTQQQPAPSRDQQATMDYAEMEEKAIPAPVSSLRRNRLSPGRVQRMDNKENNNIVPHYPRLPVVKNCAVRTSDSDLISSELRAKLKSHNLPGLR